jgi:hypothetical protein
MPSKLQLVDCFSEDGSSDLPSRLERETGLEPATLALARRCSTTELLPHGHQCSIATARLPGQRNARSIEGVFAGATVPRKRFSGRDLRHSGCLFPDQMPIAHLQNAVADRRRLRVVRDHQDGLTELLIRTPQHPEHRV